MVGREPNDILSDDDFFAYSPHDHPVIINYFGYRYISNEEREKAAFPLFISFLAEVPRFLVSYEPTDVTQYATQTVLYIQIY